MANDFNLDQFPLPKDWTRQELIDCTEDGNISYGIVQPGKHLDEGIPVLRVNNIGNNSLDLDAVMKVDPKIEEKYLRTRLLGGEVLLTLVGSTGQSIIAPEYMKGWNVARAIAVIRADENIGADWINICLQSRETHHYLNSRANTTVQKTLNLKDVRSIPIPIPPLKTKLFIENIATSLSKKIELNRQMNETLEAMAQALFKSWFVDFDPVLDNALAAGKPIPDVFAKRAEQRKAIEKKDNSDIQSLFPDAFEFTEEMGWIPKGWEVKNLTEIAEFQNGFAFYTTGYSESGYKVVDLANIHTDGRFIETHRDKHVSLEIYNLSKHEKHRLYKDDIVMAMTDMTQAMGILGKCGKIYESDKYILNQRIGRIRVKGGININFLLTYLNSSYQLNFLKTRVLGTVQKYVNTTHIKEMNFVVPQSEVMDMFGNMVDPQFNKIRELDEANVTLAKLRDTLLPKLMSGELRIPDAALVRDL